MQSPDLSSNPSSIPTKALLILLICYLLPLDVSCLVHNSTTFSRFRRFISESHWTPFQLPSMKAFRKRAIVTAPYIVGGTKITLDVLSKIAGVVHPPCVGPVINAISQIIVIVEGVKANRGDTKALVERLFNLLLVISGAYQGGDDDQLPADIRDSLVRLTSQLQDILTEVKEMRRTTDPQSFKGFITGVLLYPENGKRINEFMTNINWAMSVFQVESQINNSVRILKLADDTQRYGEIVQETQMELKALRGDLVGMATATALDALPSASILPSKPAVLYGRDQTIDEIVRRIVSTENPRFAVIGPGGIGKTAASLGVMDHQDMVGVFGDARFFVRCEQATSPGLLVDLIARGLGIEKPSTDRMRDIASFLCSATRPNFLILDNFETPWDILGEQSRVEDILYTLDSFPHVAILITMRSHTPPSTKVRWSRPFLEPLPVLSKVAARDLYLEADPVAAPDASLDTLLADLSYMPLAITLVASLGVGGETPTALLQAWRDRAMGTDLIKGTDKNNSVNISIQLSIESNRMKSVPDALTLLSVIAMLPAGANISLLPSLVPSIPNLVSSKNALRAATLVHTDNSSQILQLLSPIRSYVLKHHPPSDDIKREVYSAYLRFVSKHNSKLGSPDFPKDAAILTAEETNLEAILPDTIRAGSPAALKTAIAFSWYQAWTRPRLDVIRSVVEFCREEPSGDILASSLHCLAGMHPTQSRFDEAQVVCEEATKKFEEMNDQRGIGHSLRTLGTIYVMQGRFDKAHKAYEDASNVYKEMGDRKGVAHCLQGLGDLFRMQGAFDEARAACEGASKAYQEMGDPQYIMQCPLEMVRVESAETSDPCREMGNRQYFAYSLRCLANMHLMQGEPDKAEAALKEASVVCREIGVRRDVVRCLDELGYLHYSQGRYDDADVAYDEALQICRELDDRPGVVRYLKNLGDLHRLQGRQEEAPAS
ncbi:hypothetical protein FRB94_011408 [Tulasnella sp. JGI-2019a]|nr:hypothetical protein FRB94_011408 [Tulasnella sp. JGI-2019a]